MSDLEKKGDLSLPSSQVEIDALINHMPKAKYSVEDFFQTPEKTSFSLSSNGQFIAYLGAYQNRKNIFVQNMNSKEVTRITNETERGIMGFGWCNNSRLIYIIDSGGDENWTLKAVNADGTDLKDLTPFDKVQIQIVDVLLDDNDHIIISMNKNNPMLHEPYRLNIYTGDLKQLAENTDPTKAFINYVTDNEGKLRGVYRMNGTNTEFWYRNTEDEPFDMVYSSSFKEGFEFLNFDFEQPHIIYASSNINRDKKAIIKFDCLAGNEVEVIYENDEVDVMRMFFSKKNKKPILLDYYTSKTNYHFLDEAYAKLFKNWKAQVGDNEILIASKSLDEKHFIIKAYADVNAGTYYYYNIETGEFTFISNVLSQLDNADLSKMEPVKFIARDGLEINGYLTIPAGKQPSEVPIIINPHGGPYGIRDHWMFNPEVQLLAHYGYGVFQVNYRGSGGYGRKFQEAGYHQIGQKMQDDLTDAVHWLVNEKGANKNRVGIFGGSYGGYATLAGLTFTPELYQCGIDFVGVSNLFTFYKSMPPYWQPFIEMVKEQWYDFENETDLLKQVSPIFHINKITKPLFVVQGANDPRVNIDESDQIVSALRKKEVKVPYMVKYDEGHGFQNQENKFEFYKAMLGFLTMHLPTK